MTSKNNELEPPPKECTAMKQYPMPNFKDTE